MGERKRDYYFGYKNIKIKPVIKMQRKVEGLMYFLDDDVHEKNLKMYGGHTIN